MTRLRSAAIGCVFIGCLVALSVEVAEPQAQPAGIDRTDELLLRYNLHPALEKLGRGVGNFLCGWLEFPLNIHKRYTPADAATSLFTGAAIGVVKGAIRTGVGLYETVTFLLPYPEQYAPILPTLDYFKRADKREPLLLE